MSLEEMVVDAPRFLAETDEEDFDDSAGFDVGADALDGNAGSQIGGVVVDPCADGRKRDGMNAMLPREFQASAIAGGQKVGFAMVSAAPYWPNGVEDPSGREAEARGGFGVSGVAAVQFAAGGEQFWAGCAVNGAVHSAAAQQGGVGGVDDGVNREAGDVSRNCGEPGHGFLRGAP